jgi:hypothetical protein
VSTILSFSGIRATSTFQSLIGMTSKNGWQFSMTQIKTWFHGCKRPARCHKICVARLRLGPIDILHLPGELFVEYQLAAQQLRPESFVCMAAYGDYGPGYIGTSDAYAQGGYETSIVSRVSPRSEAILMAAIHELLE